jgi:hypothetical protein
MAPAQEIMQTCVVLTLEKGIAYQTKLHVVLTRRNMNINMYIDLRVAQHFMRPNVLKFFIQFEFTSYIILNTLDFARLLVETCPCRLPTYAGRPSHVNRVRQSD